MLSLSSSCIIRAYLVEEGVTCKPLPIVNRGMSAHVYHGTKARILSSCLFILPSTVLCDPLVSAWLLSCLQNSLGRRNPIFFLPLKMVGVLGAVLRVMAAPSWSQGHRRRHAVGLRRRDRLTAYLSCCGSQKGGCMFVVRVSPCSPHL